MIRRGGANYKDSKKRRKIHTKIRTFALYTVVQIFPYELFLISHNRLVHVSSKRIKRKKIRNNQKKRKKTRRRKTRTFTKFKIMRGFASLINLSIDRIFHINF